MPIASVSRLALAAALALTACGRPHSLPQKGDDLTPLGGCTTNEQCGDGLYCNEGSCAFIDDDETPGPTGDCSNNDDCELGTYCDDGACVQCLRDAHCADGETCLSNGTCGVAADECSRAADCADGETCTDGSCVPDTSAPECVTNTDCTLGRICDAGTCSACSSDFDCDGTDVCGANGRCIPEDVGSTPDPGNNSEDEWTCDPDYYGDGECDCGCGAIDADCNTGCAEPGCEANDCEYCYDASSEEIECGGSTETGTWACDPEYYSDGECDCGCGAIDADCFDGCSEAGCYQWDCEWCFDNDDGTECW